MACGKENWYADNRAVGGSGYVAAGEAQRANANDERYLSQLAGARRDAPLIVVISGGRNDTWFGRAQVRTAVFATFKTAREYFPRATIYAVSPVWGIDAPPPSLLIIQSDVREAVASVDGRYLNIGEPLKDHPGWVVADHVHPNDLGHGAIAEAVEIALEQSARPATRAA